MLAKRRSLRIPGNAYQGGEGYFVTLCTRGRRPFFGSGSRGAVVLSPLGTLAVLHLLAWPTLHPGLRLEEHVVMPEHIHLMVWLDGPAEAVVSSRSRWGRRSLGVIINQFKGALSKAALREHGIQAGALWQRGYHDRIIRGGEEARIREYIERHREPAPSHQRG